MRKSSIAILIVALLSLPCIIAGSLVGPSTPVIARQQDDDVRPSKGAAFDRPRLEVERGAEEAAIEYYKDIVTVQLGLMEPNTILDLTLSDLLEYLGYDNLEPREIHELGSQEIMSRGNGEEILASRFFAPKVTDVADVHANIPEGGFGWRKLVRFNSKASSAADNNNVEKMYLLQNVFENDPNRDPYSVNNVSLFNQVILTRKEGPISATNRAAYFLVLGPLVKLQTEDDGSFSRDDDGRLIPLRDDDGNLINDAKLTTFLKATFDEQDRDPETNLSAEQYFVPDACVHCHGNSRNRGKLNLLDTDHWIDRVSPRYGVPAPAPPFYEQEDFTALATGVGKILYDETELSEEGAFDIIRKINIEIKSQNELAGGSTIQLNSVSKWVDLHNDNHAHLPPYQRGTGDDTWNGNNANDRKLLYFLNRYCYRCHGSIAYSAFDKSSVKRLAGNMKDRLLEIENEGRWMPQDRIIPGLVDANNDGEVTEDEIQGELKEFFDLLTNLQADD